MKKFFFLACAALALVACTDKPEPTPKAALSISPMVNYIECGAQDVELSIKSTDSWTAELTGWSNEEETEWATLNAEGGDGDFTLVVSVANATSLTEERFVFVTVKTASKTVEAKITQKTLTLAEGEVLIYGDDGVGRIWSSYNLAAAGTFTAECDQVGSVFMFNSKKAWTFDPSKNNGAFGGFEPSADGMVPVEGYTDAVAAYSNPHTLFNEDGGLMNDDSAWKPENDPCPEGWRVPTQYEIVTTLGHAADGGFAISDDINNFNCIRVEAGQRGFNCMGFLVGFGRNVPDDVTKDNLEEKGGMFVPCSGWISEGGYLDRTWLVCLRGSTSLDDVHGGLYLSTYNDYGDYYGWGDGLKVRASAVRCIKK